MGFNSTYFIDGCTFLANASFGRCSGLRLVAAAPNSAKYGVELRSGSSHNEVYDITRRNTGGSFASTSLINDLSGGLNSVGSRGGFFMQLARKAFRPDLRPLLILVQETMTPMYSGLVLVQTLLSRLELER